MASTQSATRHRIRAAVAFASYLSVAVACGGGASTVPTPVAPSAAGSPTAAPASLEAMLTATLQDEYHAEATYQRVLAEHGQVWPFVNIVKAEARHAASLAGLFTARGLSVPSSVWTTANAPGFASVPEACGAAAQAEIDNVALYDGYLAMELPPDVRTVFENNRAASINNHLPAFTACR